MARKELLGKLGFDEEKLNTMFDVEEYIQKLIGECKNAFAERLLYVGLQGSYMRNEANEKSDIDVMLILEDFSV